MQKIIWDDDELGDQIIEILKRNSSVENPLASNTVLNIIKKENENVKIGIIRVKDSINELSEKIKTTSGKHPKYYIDIR